MVWVTSGKNKFNAIRSEYNGVVYDSKKEAKFAQTLDLMRKAKKASERVVDVKRQVRYDIRVDGSYIGFYKLDFRVLYADNIIKNYDVKGLKKGCAYQLFRLKKKLVEALHSIIIEEV